VRAFWGAHQRFFRQLCVGFKVPALVAEVRAALGSGSCVVVGLQSTGEAALERVGDSASGELYSLCAEMLRSFIAHNFPTTRHADKELAKSLAKAEAAAARAIEAHAAARAAAARPEASRSATARAEAAEAVRGAAAMAAAAAAAVQRLRAEAAADAEAAGQADPECEVAKARLLQAAAELELPPAALDLLIDECGGAAAVAEMTGRKARVVRQGRGWASQPRAKPESGEMEARSSRDPRCTSSPEARCPGSRLSDAKATSFMAMATNAPLLHSGAQRDGAQRLHGRQEARRGHLRRRLHRHLAARRREGLP